jgi:hypothetical protein
LKESDRVPIPADGKVKADTDAVTNACDTDSAAFRTAQPVKNVSDLSVTSPIPQARIRRKR